MKHIAIILLALVVTGCFSTGNEIDTAKANTFVKGETTEREVIEALGKPVTVTNSANGEKQIVYSHTNTDLDAATYIPIVGIFAGGATSTANYLIVTLDSEGIVKDWSMSETVVRTN